MQVTKNVRTRPRVLLLMDDSDDQFTIKQWLSANYDVSISTAEEFPDDNDFDLYMIDSRRVAPIRQKIRQLQDNAKPLYLPTMLVNTDKDEFSEDDDSINDIFHLPIEENDFNRRVNNALKLRAYSQDNRAIELQRKRLMQAVESASDAIAIVDKNRRVSYANKTFLKLYEQLSGETDVHKIPDKFFSESILGELFAESTQYDTSFRSEVELTLKSGHAIHLLVRLDHLFDDTNIENVVLTCTDITGRKILEQEAQVQRVLAEALRDTATALTSTLNLEVVLDRILANLDKVIPHNSANIMLIKAGAVRLARSKGYSDYDFDTLRNLFFYLKDNQHFADMKEDLYTVIIPDMETYPHKDIVWQGRNVGSYLGTPIEFQDEVLGFINLNSQEKNYFTTEQGKVLEIFSEQVAIALQNARLYEQIQEMATLEERQRVARDLHDAVSQTLFSASVISELLVRNWDSENNRSIELLEDLHELIRGALAETRVLLLEMRPEALQKGELSELLSQLTNALKSRKFVQIDLDLLPQPALPVNVKIALYRIAQEALNNIVRHSNASEVTLSLKAEHSGLVLHIADNGDGFVQKENQSSDRMGLDIMKERSKHIGADLRIDSDLDRGTTIEVTWDVEKEVEEDE